MTRESETTPDDDTESWLDAIAGRTTSGQSETEVKEAERLRLAMRELDEAAIANSKLDHDWQQLRFRLHREGLSGKRSRPTGVYWALAATLALTTGIGYLWSLNQPDAPESSVMRGKPGFVKVLRTDMPEALTANILSACHQSHVTCSRNQDASGASIVNVQITETASPVFRDTLQALGVDDLPTEKEFTLVVMRRN